MCINSIKLTLTLINFDVRGQLFNLTLTLIFGVEVCNWLLYS